MPECVWVEEEMGKVSAKKCSVLQWVVASSVCVSEWVGDGERDYINNNTYIGSQALVNVWNQHIVCNPLKLLAGTSQLK